MKDTSPPILVIEDHEEVAALVAYFLRRANYRPVIAVNGLEGLRVARALLPALIVCDVSLPELNGPAVLAVLRSDPLTEHIPLIMISGYAGARFSNPMPNAFLEKPLRANSLLATVETFIHRTHSSTASA